MNKKVSEKTEMLKLEDLQKTEALNLELLQKTEVLDLSVIQLKKKIEKTNKILFILLGVSILLLLIVIISICVKGI